MIDNEYLQNLLNRGSVTEAQQRMSECLLDIFKDADSISTITTSKQLIDYIRDHVLSSLAMLRRSAAFDARSTMSPEAISQATGLSRATVSRLITEHRN